MMQQQLLLSSERFPTVKELEPKLVLSKVHKGRSQGRKPSDVVCSFEVGSQPLWLRADGKVWRRTQGAVSAYVPLKGGEFEAVYAGRALAPELCKADKTRVPPVGWLVRLRRALEGATGGESVAYLARLHVASRLKGRVPVYLWIGVVPPQEASGGHFQTGDLTRMWEWTERQRLDVVGHMHVHPEGYSACSMTDVADWQRVPGLYVVAPRETDRFGLYWSTGGEVFDYKQVRVGKGVKLPETCVIRGDHGQRDWEENIVDRPILYTRPVIAQQSRRSWGHLHEQVWKRSKKQDDRQRAQDRGVTTCMLCGERTVAQGWCWSCGSRERQERDVDTPTQSVGVEVVKAGVAHPRGGVIGWRDAVLLVNKEGALVVVSKGVLKEGEGYVCDLEDLLWPVRCEEAQDACTQVILEGRGEVYDG